MDFLIDAMLIYSLAFQSEKHLIEFIFSVGHEMSTVNKFIKFIQTLDCAIAIQVKRERAY